MKEPRKKAAKEGGDDPMSQMRERYDRAVEADRDNRTLGISDLKFVTVPGEQWDQAQRKARRKRPCYEFPILRSHWRQVVNDQKKARPGIKVRAVEDGDAKGAELRQGIVRNIESRSNADKAYDRAFEYLSAAGWGVFRCATRYSSDDAWEQDLCVEPVEDPLNCVWADPDSVPNNREYVFVEDSVSREAFKQRWPGKDAVDFDSQAPQYGDWFGEKDIRIAEYWRKVPVTKQLLLLSDGRTVDAAETDIPALEQQGVQVIKQRECHGSKVVMSIVSGKEELEGPFDSVFPKIPLVECYANRFKIDGKWVWSGLVRPARDAQKLANYNITTGQESLSKQHKAVPLVTPKMLEGNGVKELWDASNAADVPYLPFTPDERMPGGPHYLAPPPIHAAFVQMGQMSIDLVKSATGIFDASLGAKSNETSGKAILARQSEGDTATFDYQDALAEAIQAGGELLLAALPKVYDTPRAMRVIGKDGAEDWVHLYQEQPDGSVVNDLSAGKYDVTVTTGPAYDTQRMEFVDALTQLGQGNPAIAAGVPDLIVGALDFPKAEEAAERLKLLLPPQIQQALAQKDTSPEVAQARAMAEQQIAQAKQQMDEMGQQMQQLTQENQLLKVQNANKQGELQLKYMELSKPEAAQDNSSEQQKLSFEAWKAQQELEIERMDAITRRMSVIATAQANAAELEQQALAEAQAETGEGGEAKAKPAPLQSALDSVSQAVAGMAASQAQLAQALAGLSQPKVKQTRVLRDDKGAIIGAESVE